MAIQADELVEAARSNDEDTLHLLLELGVSVNCQGTGATPLIAACENASISCIRHLISSGANVNLASLRGNTPLRAAVLSGDSECIAMMLALNPTLESATGTALAAAAQLGDCETLNVLVAAGADIAHESRDGVTALIAAVIADQHQAIKLLLSLGADPTATSKDGVSAVDIAQKRNLPVAYSLLLQASILHDANQALVASESSAAERKLVLESSESAARLLLEAENSVGRQQVASKVDSIRAENEELRRKMGIAPRKG